MTAEEQVGIRFYGSSDQTTQNQKGKEEGKRAYQRMLKIIYYCYLYKTTCLNNKYTGDDYNKYQSY